jgi:hypothetical protein
MIADPGADQAPGHTVSRSGHWAVGRFHPCRMETRLASGVAVYNDAGSCFGGTGEIGRFATRQEYGHHFIRAEL